MTSTVKIQRCAAVTETEGAALCCTVEDATSVKQGISVRFLCQVLLG